MEDCPGFTSKRLDQWAYLNGVSRAPRIWEYGPLGRRELQTQRGRQYYALRMEIVESVFGEVKQGWCFRQFLLRWLEKVNGEWLLICTGHNLLRFGQPPTSNRCIFPCRFPFWTSGSYIGSIRPLVWRDQLPRPELVGPN